MSTETELIPESAMQLIEDVKAFCTGENVVSVTITNQVEYTGAAELGKKLKQFERQIEDERKTAKEPHLEAGRRVDDIFNGVKVIIQNRVQALGSALRGFEAEQEKKRLEAQRAAEEIARKERERIEAQAAAARAKEEAAQRAAEEARRKAQESTNAAERVKLEAEARKRESEAVAAAEKASVKEMIAEQVVAPVIETSAVKVQGVSTRKNWKAQVLDKKAFILYAVQTDQIEYIDINMPNVNKYVKMIEDTKPIPGLRIFNDPSTAFKG